MTDRPDRRVHPVALALLLGLGAALFALLADDGLLVGTFFLLVIGAVTTRARWDATSYLTFYVVLLFALPARFVIGPIGAGGTPAAVVGLGAAVLWMIGRGTPRFGMASGRHPMRVILLLVVASVLASYSVATSQSLAPEELRSADRGVFLMVSMVGAALLLLDGVDGRERYQVLMRRLVTAASSVAALGIVQYALAIDITPWLQLPGLSVPTDASFVFTRIHVRRVAGTMAHPIEFGVVLAVLLPLASHFAFIRWRERRRLRVFIPAGLMALGIPLSVSRSAYLAAAIAALIVVPTWPGPRRLLAVILAPFAALGMSAVFPGVLGTIRGLVLGFGEDPSVQARTDDYAQMPYFIEGFLWLGRGFRTFVPERYILLDNQWLMSLAETGVVGVALMGAFFVVPIAAMATVWRRTSGREDRELAVALAAALAAAAGSFATFDALSFPTMAGVTFLLVGAAGVHWRSTLMDRHG